MMKTSKKRIQGLLICMFTDGLGSQRVRFYLNAEVTALPAIGSDHSPLILSTLHAQMGASKAPGPDGLNGLFFHQHWQDIGADVFREVHRFFESDIIAEEQSAFVGSRQIQDNILNRYAQYASWNPRRLSTL